MRTERRKRERMFQKERNNIMKEKMNGKQNKEQDIIERRRNRKKK